VQLQQAEGDAEPTKVKLEISQVKDDADIMLANEEKFTQVADEDAEPTGVLL
jgi:hypothetical protein